MEFRHSVQTAILLGCAAFMCGCGGTSPKTITKTSNVPATPVEKRVSDRPANTDGKVFIVEYHTISTKEARWDRSIAKFKSDLARLYKMNFRPVTVSEYLDNKMPLAPGASPVIFTFDDANPSQFKILDDGKIDPNCAVGIWQEFAKTHPDFPVKATFYVLPGLWAQPKHVEEKVKMLKEWGSELGSHTLTHRSLKKIGEDEVKKELSGAIDMLKTHGFENVSIALPYGISPKNTELLKKFSYQGKEYSMRGAMLVGANPAPPVTSKDFNPYRIPRIQGIDDDYGITYWLNQVEKGNVKLYVQP